jgi:hypothetical protein
MKNKEEKILQLLERLLYSDYSKRCPICNESFMKYGHRPDCDLAEMLLELGTDIEINFQRP